jgi:hypothetical protein
MSGEHCCSRFESKNHAIALALLLVGVWVSAFRPPVMISTMNTF